MPACDQRTGRLWTQCRQVEQAPRQASKERGGSSRSVAVNQRGWVSGSSVHRGSDCGPAMPGTRLSENIR